MLSVFESSETGASFASSFLPSPKPPLPKFVTMSSLATNSSLSRLSVGSDGVSSVAGHVEGSGSPPEPGSTVVVSIDDAQPQRFYSVWDFHHVKKSGTKEVNPEWTCLWCHTTFKKWNATKVLYHLTKTGGKDVRVCKAAHDKTSKQLYNSFLNDRATTQTGAEQRAANFQAMVGEGQQSLAVMFESVRQRNSTGGNTAATTAGDTGNKQRVFRQEYGVEASTASQLTMAIADFVHSSGLPFSITQGEYFKNILKYARGVSMAYKAPSRNALSTTLLRLNYNRRIEK